MIPCRYLAYLNIITLFNDNFFCFSYRQYIFLPKIDALMRQVYPFDFPYVDHLQKQTKLLFVNAHTSFDYPEPLPPNIIAVGGLHIKEPKPLPKVSYDYTIVLSPNPDKFYLLCSRISEIERVH